MTSKVGFCPAARVNSLESGPRVMPDGFLGPAKFCIVGWIAET